MHSLFSDKASRHPQRRALRTCPDEGVRLVSDRAPLKVREDDLGPGFHGQERWATLRQCAVWMCVNTSKKASAESALLK
jgi:hypothetical protein